MAESTVILGLSGVTPDTNSYIIEYQRADGTFGRVNRQRAEETFYARQEDGLVIPLKGVQAQALPIDDVVAAFTVTAEYYSLKISSEAGAVPITLGDAEDFTGFTFVFKKISADSNAVTITPGDDALIENRENFILLNQGDTVSLQCDGYNWWVVASSFSAFVGTPLTGEAGWIVDDTTGALLLVDAP